MLLLQLHCCMGPTLIHYKQPQLWTVRSIGYSTSMTAHCTVNCEHTVNYQPSLCRRQHFTRKWPASGVVTCTLRPTEVPCTEWCKLPQLCGYNSVITIKYALIFDTKLFDHDAGIPFVQLIRKQCSRNNVHKQKPQ